MRAREVEIATGSILTSNRANAGGRGSESVIERLGHPQTPDIKEEIPELKNAMRRPSVEEMTTRAPLPPGYRYQYLDRQQVPTLIAALKAWYPGIVVGNASCHLRESFYTEKVCLDSQFERDFLVVLSSKTTSSSACSRWSEMRTVKYCTDALALSLQSIEAHV